jgi:glycosyltransferase involved in cell wall biosynthesis
MIESMACGTPVIAFNCGSVPEIMEDGLTGFVVENVDQAVAACRKLGQLFRPSIRSRFEERFSVAAMAREYVKIYEELASMGKVTAIAAE